MVREELELLLPDLRTWAKKFAGPHYDVDDLVTDVIIKFLERADRFKPERGPLKNYLFSCIRNRAFDAMKAYHRKGQQRLRKYLHEEAPLYITDEQQASGIELRMELEDRVQRLPKRLAEPFRLFALEGRGYPEIAQMMGVQPAYVKSLIHRARAKIRELFDAA